jgi:hypothetical protein
MLALSFGLLSLRRPPKSHGRAVQKVSQPKNGVIVLPFNVADIDSKHLRPWPKKSIHNLQTVNQQVFLEPYDRTCW